MIDEYTRKCLAIVVDPRLRLDDVLHCLTDLFVEHGCQIISARITARSLPLRPSGTSSDALVKTLYIEPGSPWENGYSESFNGKLRDGLLNGEILYTLREAQVLIERWRQTYDRIRLHEIWASNAPARCERETRREYQSSWRVGRGEGPV